MEIIKAEPDMKDIIREITHSTIDAVYPLYYPHGAVEFFKALHSEESIVSDLEKGNTYLLYEGDKPAATITVRDDHIMRLFVLFVYQRRGFGSRLLDFAEEMIAGRFSEAVIDASFPAKTLYLRRGYSEMEFNTVKTENGDYLCYDVMSKKLK